MGSSDTKADCSCMKSISGCVFIENENLTNFPFTKQKSNELPQFNTFKLVRNNETIGYVLYRRASNVLNILSMEISQQYRKQGLGKEFFSLLEKTAKKYRTQNIMVVVDSNYMDGKNFFTSCGLQQFNDTSPHILIKKLA